MAYNASNRKQGAASICKASYHRRHALESRLLKNVPVDYECDVIYQSETHGAHFKGSFSSLVDACRMSAPGGAQNFLYKAVVSAFRSLGEGDDLLSGFNACIMACGLPR